MPSTQVSLPAKSAEAMKPDAGTSQDSLSNTDRILLKRREAAALHPVSIDKDGMPLPRQVSVIDTNATRVSSAGYAQKPAQSKAPLKNKPAKVHTQPVRVTRKKVWQQPIGCLLRILIALVFAGILIALIVGSIGIYQYYAIAATLPDVSTLREHASQFETTRILDRNGNVLYEILDPNAGRRTYVPLSQISPYLIAATIATEDKAYYSNPGFDPIAILPRFMAELHQRRHRFWSFYHYTGIGEGFIVIPRRTLPANSSAEGKRNRFGC